MKQKDSKREDNTVFVGIDLGTSRSSISASNNTREWIESYVGWPKDFIALQVVGKPVLFGAEALKNRLSLDLCRPLEHGVIKEGIERSEEAVKEIIKYLIELAKPEPDQKIHAVVGVPADTLKVNKLAIRKAVSEFVHSLMVVSEPFAVAYGMDLLNNSLVIDIGAGTTDFCIMHGTIPSEEDQKTILAAGDYIDEQLYSYLTERYPNAKFNKNMVRQFKEQHSFVREVPGEVRVEIPVDGKPVMHDITNEIRRACESILPAIVETTTEMIARFDPEFQVKIKNNIVLAGGGSLIKGIREYLQDALKEYGSCRVTCVEDPLFAGSNGALKLAEDMPAKYWETL
ncbi:MAG: rod shape-determining protein [Nitrospirae bacterium]|nr:rod shape-determining protein [Nitrospirota bacterium]MCL5423390.1 rod shape-determining protein [Nitrospirota bacterium]